MVLLKLTSPLLTAWYTSKSTFHYGSIKMVSLQRKQLDFIISTFHYGSIKIYIKPQVEELLCRSTFHYGSIKIDIKALREIGVDFIYIPLWFY